jgi:hypothetical protein
MTMMAVVVGCWSNLLISSFDKLLLSNSTMTLSFALLPRFHLALAHPPARMGEISLWGSSLDFFAFVRASRLL